MAPVGMPFGRGPLVRGAGKGYRGSIPVAQLTRGLRDGGAGGIRRGRERRIDIDHDLGFRVAALDETDELESLLGLAFRILGWRQHEGQLRRDTVPAAGLD